jgi:2-polyprenyl-3-methyl-5-hydroxy-6-metoxy-1,4-benzoquinol methylase
MTTHPSGLIDLGGSVAAVTAAYEAGLVDSLSRPAPAEEHAKRLGLDPEAVELVLDTLVAVGVAEKRNGRIAASGAFALATGNLLDSLLPARELWSHLPQFLRTGERYVHMDGPTGERAAEYKKLVGTLGHLFENAAEDIAAKLPPPGERILDVGAGSGVWSLAMCAHSQTTRVTALDLAEVLPAFVERAAQLGLSSRIDTLPGDFHSIELPAASFDRVVLANVLHLEAASQASSLIGRVAPALRASGELVVVDCFADGRSAHEQARAVYALHLAMRTSEGRLHSRSQIERWATEAGLANGELLVPDVPPWSVTALVHRRIDGAQALEAAGSEE